MIVEGSHCEKAGREEREAVELDDLITCLNFVMQVCNRFRTQL